MTRSAFSSTVMLTFGLLLVPGSAAAQGGGDEVIDLSNDWVPVPPPPPGSLQTIAGDDPVEQVVYLNFDGATLTSGGSDAIQNSTFLVTSASLAYPAMTASSATERKAMAELVLKEIKILYLEFAVKFVLDRPTSGEYSMVMIGGNGKGTSMEGRGAVGIAPMDCGNKNKKDIVLVASDSLGSRKALDIAHVAAHELGHAFGLEHVQDPTDIMYYQKSSQTCCWTTSNIDKPRSDGGKCGNDPQDAKKVLAKNVGMGAGDTVQPLAWFRYPGPGAVLPPDFTFEVDATDNYMVRKVTLYLDDTEVVSLSAPPFKYFATGVADGDHILKAVVYDANPNNKVEITTSVTVQSGCAREGVCTPGLGGVGLSCQSGDDCVTGVCAVKDGQGICSLDCTQQKDWEPCPTGTRCTDAGGEMACTPATCDSSGTCTPGAGYSLSRAESGCAVGRAPGTGLATGIPLLLLLVLGLVRRKDRK